VADQHRLDLVRLVGGEPLGIALDRRTLAPLDVDDFGVQALALAEIDPQVGELPDAGGEHLVAGGERVGDCRLPAAGARGREEEDLAGAGLEDLLQVLEQAEGEGGKVGRPLILQRDVHGEADRIRHVGRAGNEEGVAS
jgi:hypothetical protein